MSLVIQEGNKGRELKLKLLKILHSADHTHSEFFTGNNPGYFNNALGHNRLKRWYKIKKKYDSLQLLLLGIMTPIAGTYVVTQEPTSIFGWFFILWGIGCNVLLYYEKQVSDEDRDEYDVELKKDQEELKKKHEKLEKDFYEFRHRLENK